ncbi:head-tail adaptor protein [Neomegalonema sp.]|uniref:head-tail adaptor protein n=1 Tax=Neomegalonema sp. TaxID=2039713 RepID=UPI00262413D3|nr:head-tail adaptor protein [Neomegalonema sp.]MDD2870234.1 head-tail adaptor protein [Neomegalonema sp.]
MARIAPLAAGKRPHLVRLERAVETRNALNEPVRSWELIAEVRASRVDVLDSEKVQAAELAAEIRTQFGFRWSPTVAGVTPRDRLICEGVAYAIRGVRETCRRRVGIEMTTVRRAE